MIQQRLTDTEPRGNRRARRRGALAGLVPFGAIVLLFAVSGSFAPPSEVARSLAAVAAIAIVAGFLAGPLVVRRPHGHRLGVIGYALASIASTYVLALIQAAWETWTSHGLDPLAIAGAIGAQAAYGLISTLYLIIPALVLGAMWTLALWALERLTGEPPRPPARARAT